MRAFKNILETAIVKAILFGILAVSIGAPATMASQHFETEQAKAVPSYDLTDLYVFEAERDGYTVFILDVNPTTPSDGSVAFGETGVYSIHISTDELMTAGMSINATFDDGMMQVSTVDTPNPELGLIGDVIGKAEIGEDTTFENGVRVWAGGANDPFVGDSKGIGAFRKALVKGTFDAGLFTANDFFGTLHSSIIVIEIPNTMLPEQIHVFGKSADKRNGEWVQINRIGHVLMTHLFLHNAPDVQLAHVSNTPDTDQDRFLPLSGSVARAVTLAGSQDNPIAYADGVANRLLPDMIPYTVGSEASYAVDKINGRSTRDDAMDVVLSIFSGMPVSDGASTFDQQPTAFPYVVPTNP